MKSIIQNQVILIVGSGIFINVAYSQLRRFWRLWKHSNIISKSDDASHVIPVNKIIPESDNVIFDVIFFPDSRLGCRFFNSMEGCTQDNCRYTHETTSLWRVVEYIEKASVSLEVCVYMMSCYELCQAVIRVYRRGVRVRVLTEGMEVDSSGSQIGSFRAEGISVRFNETGPSILMHHKFIIVDDKLLINGSLNWTQQAVTLNHENVIVTNSKHLVRSFSQEFNKLWNNYAIRK